MNDALSKEDKLKIIKVEEFLIVLMCTLVGLLLGYIGSLPIAIILIIFGVEISQPVYLFMVSSFIGSVIGYKYGLPFAHKYAEKERELTE